MRAGQFHNRKPRNVFGAGKSERGDEFNASYKRERHPEAQQFPTGKVDEFRRYSETRDARPKRAESRSASSSSGRDSSGGRGGKSRNSSYGKKSAHQMTQGFIRSAVGMMAGAVIVTNSYQAMAEERDFKRLESQQVAAIEELMQTTDWPNGVWTWSDDYTIVTFSLPGFEDIAATVTEEVEPPTCTEDGTTTYTAAVTIKDYTFTDTQVEISADAAGHSFGQPRSSDGKTVFRCTACDKEFEIEYGITEEH